jgi:hypothetical protein
MSRIISKFFKITNLLLLTLLASCAPTTQVKTTAKGPTTEVALMLPLSGDQAHIGMKLERVIRKGFADVGGENFNIISYDTANDDSLNRSVNQALSKKSKIIIGPLYSSESKYVADKVKGSEITMISLSNDPSLASRGAFVYGHAPKYQNQRLMDYLLAQGYSNFILLLPVGSYFLDLNKELQSLIVRSNAVLVRSEFYPNDHEGINVAVRNVLMAVDRLNEDEQNTKKPVVLVIDDTKNFAYLLEELGRANIDQKAELVSDWRINIPASRGLNYVFTGSSQMADRDKLSSLQAAAGTQYPSTIDYIAYDLGGIISKCLNQKYDKQQFVNNLRSYSFSGVSGRGRFQGYIASRPYDIIKHTSRGYELLEEYNETPSSEKASN